MKRGYFYTPTKIQGKQSINHLYTGEEKKGLSTMTYGHKPVLSLVSHEPEPYLPEGKRRQPVPAKQYHKHMCA